jgi:hypothetical protein
MKSVIATLLLLASLSCMGMSSRVVLHGPIQRQGDGWDLTLNKVKDGPNVFSVGNMSYGSGEGQRFIWVYLSLHNPSRAPRKFSFDRCDLDLRDQNIVPVEIALDWVGGPAAGASREPELAADETIKRALVFPYPDDRSPTQLRCLPVTIPLPQF